MLKPQVEGIYNGSGKRKDNSVSRAERAYRSEIK
jgi:hypothetical protein